MNYIRHKRLFSDDILVSTVRDVGQANWNEILFGNETKIVFDAGAPCNASKSEVISLIGNRNASYSLTKPILVLSHWDKDHYHALVGMSNEQLQNSFSAFICRDKAPNLTSRILFSIIKQSLNSLEVFALSYPPKPSPGLKYFATQNLFEKQITIYNAIKNRDRNKSGLVLLTRTKDGSVILPADCSYKQMSSDILHIINYGHKHNLVVPHHGGKVGRYHYRVPPLAEINKAAISVGDNDYRHPLEEYLDRLTNTGFSIKQTNHTGDISFEI